LNPPPKNKIKKVKMRNNEVLQFFNIITDFIASGEGTFTTKAGRKKRKKETKNLIKILFLKMHLISQVSK
jgi:BRCT domain type II-containing protein